MTRSLDQTKKYIGEARFQQATQQAKKAVTKAKIEHTKNCKVPWRQGKAFKQEDNTGRDKNDQGYFQEKESQDEDKKIKKQYSQ